MNFEFFVWGIFRFALHDKCPRLNFFQQLHKESDVLNLLHSVRLFWVLILLIYALVMKKSFLIHLHSFILDSLCRICLKKIVLFWMVVGEDLLNLLPKLVICDEIFGKRLLYKYYTCSFDGPINCDESPCWIRSCNIDSCQIFCRHVWIGILV